MSCIVFDRSITHDLERALRREWLETNGLGGWASSTIVGAHTRRYHGLLVAATRPPVGRVVLLSKLDELVVVDGQHYDLGCNKYPSAVHPRGFEHLMRFRRDLFPEFEYEAGPARIRKTIAAIQGENMTVVMYEVLEAPGPVDLELKPFVAARDYHHLSHENDRIRRETRFSADVLQVRPYLDSPDLFIKVPGAAFDSWPDWYRNFEYPVERSRGLDYYEDLFCYGTFRVRLEPGRKLGVVVSMEHPAKVDGVELLDKERARREALEEACRAEDDLVRWLCRAADQFIVHRGKDLRTIIAGYHWFSDWGRDTMISLPGLCLVTRRLEDARRILKAFAVSASEGMLPNRFPDEGETPEYNTVDATLWFFVAIHKYLAAGGDDGFVRGELLPVLRDILAWHDRGTRYGIKVDKDGLLLAGEPGTQLTWMDAKVFDWVVTPRHGKAVEINALWFNALSIFANLASRFGLSEEAQEWQARAERVKEAFRRVFWNQESQCLFDCVNGEEKDASIRPNQVFALSLPFSLLPLAEAKKVLQVIEEHLLTPYGLRSLSPRDRQYRPHYGGDQLARDGAYHQGTVWGWLLGPYLTALMRVRGPDARGKAIESLAGIREHLRHAGVGSVSEIFDAEAPHAPRGCIAQAWSVAEILRACVEDLGLPA